MSLLTIVSAFLYVGVYELASRTDFSAKFCACIAIIPPYLLSVIFRAIQGVDVITVIDLVILIAQLLAALFVINKSRYFNSIMAWFFWGIAGLVVIVLFIPEIIMVFTH
ncbi:MAG: hypothetical protein ACOH18_01045 [Candidatus Saccharimonadaceae bacterium]